MNCQITNKDTNQSHSVSFLKTKSFKDLIVWQKAHELVLLLYTITRIFPKNEEYGLTSQMRRAGVSVPANIAEGYRRKGKIDKIRFLNISQSSLEEVRYYLILSKDLKYITDNQKEMELLEEVSRILTKYCDTILRNSDS